MGKRNTIPLAGRATPRRAKSRGPKALLIGACLLVLAVIAIELGLFANRAPTSGSLTLRGLTAPVRVERDRLDVPRIRAANRLDAVRALGFVHGQERFFQMDLSRRTAAGEQAELLGQSAVAADRTNRVHEFRRRAVAVLARLDAQDRAALQAYADGVNAGLASRRTRPIEYWLLGEEPAPWRPEDSLLVLYSLFIGLQGGTGNLDYARGLLRERLDEATYAYVFENGSPWSSTMDGSSAPILEPPAPFTPDQTASEGGATDTAGQSWRETEHPGSNIWAVSGNLTKSGRALLANDLHLPLTMPNAMFQVELSYRDDSHRQRTIDGFTVPGIPLVLIGSNGSVAWGVTNAAIDTIDLVELEENPARPGSYRTPEGWRTFGEDTETIKVRHGEPITLKIENTVWGPVIENRKFDGRRLVLKWSAHEPTALNLDFCRLEMADDVASGLKIAQGAGLPPINIVLTDSGGHIGWTLGGYLPDRVGFDGTVPVSFADGTCYWAGPLAHDRLPEIVDPKDGRLWNSNNWSVARTPDYVNGGFDDGGRAYQVHQALTAASRFTEQSFLVMQHDDAGDYFRRWALLFQRLLRQENGIACERRDELLGLIAKWDGHATVGTPVFPLVRDFRLKVIGEVSRRWLRQPDMPPGVDLHSLDVEEPVWRMVNPAAGTDRTAVDAMLMQAVQQVLTDSDNTWGRDCPLAKRTWGERNRLDARHRLSTLMPWLGRWFDGPLAPQAGDDHMPLVAGPAFGAAARLVVSPGAENKGLVQMPGGQDGDPLSAHYDDQFASWLTRHGTPLQPGAAREELRLEPVANR